MMRQYVSKAEGEQNRADKDKAHERVAFEKCSIDRRHVAFTRGAMFVNKRRQHQRDTSKVKGPQMRRETESDQTQPHHEMERLRQRERPRKTETHDERIQA